MLLPNEDNYNEATCDYSVYKVLTSPNKPFTNFIFPFFPQTYWNRDLSQLVLPWWRWWRQQKDLAAMLWEPPEKFKQRGH